MAEENWRTWAKLKIPNHHRSTKAKCRRRRHKEGKKIKTSSLIPSGVNTQVCDRQREATKEQSHFSLPWASRRFGAESAVGGRWSSSGILFVLLEFFFCAISRFGSWHRTHGKKNIIQPRCGTVRSDRFRVMTFVPLAYSSFYGYLSPSILRPFYELWMLLTPRRMWGTHFLRLLTFLKEDVIF